MTATSPKSTLARAADPAALLDGAGPADPADAAGRRVAVLATGPDAAHHALTWRQVTSGVVLLLHGTAAPDAERTEQLAALAVPVVDTPVAERLVQEGRLVGVRLVDGSTVAVDLLTGSGAPVDDGVLAAETAAAVADFRERQVTTFAAEAWEALYLERDQIWSGDPNRQLVAEAAHLPPGRALDVGCGEGADALWLAARGWQVTGTDISPTALDRAAAHAAHAATDGSQEPEGGSTTWVLGDLRESPPQAESFDLVNSQYMHLPTAQRRELFAALARAVAPGGTLLVVGHHPWDLRLGAGSRYHFPDMFFTAEEVAASLDPAAWEVLVAATRPRPPVEHEGRVMVRHDAVMVARRRGRPS